MKKTELTYAVLSVVMDFLMIVLAALAAYFIRFETQFTDIRPVIYAIPFGQFMRVVLMIAFFWLCIFATTGLYNLRERRKYYQEISKIVLGCSTGILLVILIIFFRKEELFSSRFIVLAVWFLSIFFLILGRGVLNILKKTLYKHGIGVRRVLMIGNDKTTNAIIEGFQRDKGLGYSMIKHYKNLNNGAMHELTELLAAKKIDDIFLADTSIERNSMIAIKNLTEEFHVSFHYTADIFDAQATNLEITTVNDIPVIELKKTPLDGWGRVLKRIFDLVGALIGCMLLSPIMILTAIAIKLESKGPIIYKNERVSKDGNFYTYKFRSMYSQHCTGNGYGGNKAQELEEKLILQHNKRKGPLYKVQNDPRKTRVGRFIDMCSIDELPQFFNIIKGEMSIVGPRPHQPREVEKYEKRHKKTLSIKPGTTGLAQISGRSDLDFEDEVRLDTYYIENWSLWLDLYIILKTPMVVLRRRKNV